MAHLNHGTLRRMVDDPDAVAAPDREHFAGCAECKSRFAGTSFDANAAYRRMTARPARPRFGLRLPILRPASRAMVAALALVVLVAVGVTAAVNVSNIFQPQTVKPVPISVADLESLPKLGTYGDFKWTKEPSPAIGISKADAEKVAGFSAPDASSLPAGVTADQVTYAATAEIVGTFTFSAAKAQAAAAAQGKTLPAMPAGMDGTTLTMTIGPAIVELYGNVTPPASGSTDVSQMLATARTVVARRGRQWTDIDTELFFAVYEETAAARRQVIRESEQPRRRRVV